MASTGPATGRGCRGGPAARILDEAALAGALGHAEELRASPAGSPELPSYTRGMRRRLCVIALLFGFAGEGYAWTVRPRTPVPIERQLEAPDGRAGTVPTSAWWVRP